MARVGILVDTDILIDYFNTGQHAAVLDDPRNRLYYSVVTRKELLTKPGLKDSERQVRLMRAGETPLFVEPSRILACEEGLNPRYVNLGRQSAEVICIEGAGALALSISGQPLRLQVTPEEPVAVPLRSLLTWQGQLETQLLDDEQMREVLASPDHAEGMLVRLRGTGVVEVEKAV